MFKQNSNSPYKGNPEDKLKILNLLSIKVDCALKLSQAPIGDKNLVYLSVFGNDYVMLLELLLKTIVLNTKAINFELLFITDSHTQKIIESVDVVNNFKYNFYIVNTPADGVEASITKTKIFSYPGINKYSKILYLDADIISIKDISYIFNTPFDPQKIEVVASPLVHLDLSKIHPGLIKCASLSHSLGFFTDRDKEYILKKDPKIFNAGQYLLVNTPQMQAHFKNIEWLMSVWPTAYFFEQSFMNHYFVVNKLTSFDLLDKNVSILTDISNIRVPNNIPAIEHNLVKQHKDEHSLIHFAGTPTNGCNKFQTILLYCEHYNICL
jgi:lipopolysaccharide biosynthesis glycosyltransferase